MPPLSIATSGIGTIESLTSSVYANLIEGSWNIASITTTSQIPIQAFPTPIGRDGNRASVMNGVGLAGGQSALMRMAGRAALYLQIVRAECGVRWA